MTHHAALMKIIRLLPKAQHANIKQINRFLRDTANKIHNQKLPTLSFEKSIYLFTNKIPPSFSDNKLFLAPIDLIQPTFSALAIALKKSNII